MTHPCKTWFIYWHHWDEKKDACRNCGTNTGREEGTIRACRRCGEVQRYRIPPYSSPFWETILSPGYCKMHGRPLLPRGK